MIDKPPGNSGGLFQFSTMPTYNNTQTPSSGLQGGGFGGFTPTPNPPTPVPFNPGNGGGFVYTGTVLGNGGTVIADNYNPTGPVQNNNNPVINPGTTIGTGTGTTTPGTTTAPGTTTTPGGATTTTTPVTTTPAAQTEAETPIYMQWWFYLIVLSALAGGYFLYKKLA